jgi:hypothetical protein
MSCNEDDPIIEDLIVSVEKTDVTELGASDGSITLTVTGGQDPISYQWSNGESTKDLTNLEAGTYDVTVADASDLVVYESVEITEPDMLTQTVTISVGEGYSKDIYYSLKNGEVSMLDRTEWDIAFYTNPMSSSILTNDGNGIKLYVWPGGDKNAWADVDTANMASWIPQYNTYSDSTWENGAFDKNDLGHPDYGWGQYDMTTHGVYGDSIHVIVFADGSAKKLFIEKRQSSDNTFHIKYANLDGNDEITDTVSAGLHLDKNMIHYSLSNKATVVHEPAASEWDLMFTKYYDESIPYIVTGVLSNNDIEVAEMVDSDITSNDYLAGDYSKVINTIGSDWKSFDMSSFTYVVAENLVYFAKDLEGNYYKIAFTTFEGSSSGNLSFELTTYK